MRLIDMTPRLDVASTGYALVNAGQEYLVLQPTGDRAPFTVDLAAGPYAVEWFNVTTRESSTADSVSVETAGSTSFTAPFNGPAVLYLRRHAG
jgi:hypothetical protein